METKIKITQLNEHIYLMRQDINTGYIIVGKEKTLVIDTMAGYENVSDVVKSITDLPIMVVNTHGHCDHIYGNVFFEEAYMNLADLDVAKSHMALPEFVEACEKYHMEMPKFHDLKDKECIELGGLTLEVIYFPGHTPGGICLLLKQDRILFAGDSINHHLWMQLNESAKLKDYLDTLEAHMYLLDEADYILHGHAEGFDDISLLKDVRDGIKDLILTHGEGDLDYKWFGGIAKQHVFEDGKGVICYTKEKF